jgi:predicted secreted hydrolase
MGAVGRGPAVPAGRVLPLRRRTFLVSLAALLPAAALAQGFAGLGTDAGGFAIPQRGVPFDFPADHGPHPDYRIEWWYLTANLTGDDGRDYGIQWTLFRNALAPGEAEGWDSPQVWMAHAAVTTPDGHHVAERFARGGIGAASVTAEPFAAVIDDWAMQGPTLADVNVTAQGTDFAYDLQFTANGPFVPQGDGGFSVKSAEGQASSYYSQPFYSVAGTLSLPSGEVAVTGSGWLDREWSSQPLSGDQTGWDWFSLHLDTGEKVMGFQLRSRTGAPYTAATWITPDGTPTPFPDGAFRAQPLEITQVAGRDVPTAWALTLPDRGLAVEVRALQPQAWMDTAVEYWEGPVRITGSHTGRGYLEMTGYE